MDFNELVHELSLILDVPLEPESNQACSILIDDKLTLQLEMDQKNPRLLVFAYICIIPPGKFRENVLLQTLKANNQAIRVGTFAFLESTGELAFFHFLRNEEISPQKIANFLTEFIYVASLWFDAISAGKVAPDEFAPRSPSTSGPNPFGLKP